MLSRIRFLSGLACPFPATSAPASAASLSRAVSGMLLLSLLAAGIAQARAETLRWQHDDPSRVSRFEAQVGTQLGVYDRNFDLGKPTPDASQVYSASIQVGDQEDVYIALRALGTDGVWSARSEFRYRPAPGSPPIPNPDPAPTPGSPIDFESNSLGQSPTGWLDTRANHSMQEDDTLFRTLDFGGSRVFYTDASDSNIHSHLTTSGFPTANYAVRGRMRADILNASMGVTAYSNYPNDNRYYRLGGSIGASNRFMISHQGLSLSCSQPDTGVAVGDDEWFRFELRVENESNRTRLQAKVWPEGTTEPGAFQQTCYDTSGGRRTSGAMGVWSSSAGQRYWDDLEMIQLSAPPAGGGAGVPLAPPVLIGISPVDN